jgi:hypothetical protein
LRRGEQYRTSEPYSHQKRRRRRGRVRPVCDAGWRRRPNPVSAKRVARPPIRVNPTCVNLRNKHTQIGNPPPKPQQHAANRGGYPDICAKIFPGSAQDSSPITHWIENKTFFPHENHPLQLFSEISGISGNLPIVAAAGGWQNDSNSKSTRAIFGKFTVFPEKPWNASVAHAARKSQELSQIFLPITALSR